MLQSSMPKLRKDNLEGELIVTVRWKGAKSCDVLVDMQGCGMHVDAVS